MNLNRTGPNSAPGLLEQSLVVPVRIDLFEGQSQVVVLSMPDGVHAHQAGREVSSGVAGREADALRRSRALVGSHVHAWRQQFVV